ncbi:hypothetical protein O1611_g8859 [Lasiodiplodia mahajangana]|uniref:Uncharacterized protein n=1 Tax=Lasiodiplodia mahajangana TaxID=1108764 RepID=A0ACC2JBJ1_9PEZI|nr:hypothetical protein O1611_g8859 [Lasiodiplodia mahajangana]
MDRNCWPLRSREALGRAAKRSSLDITDRGIYSKYLARTITWAASKDPSRRPDSWKLVATVKEQYGLWVQDPQWRSQVEVNGALPSGVTKEIKRPARGDRARRAAREPVFHVQRRKPDVNTRITRSATDAIGVGGCPSRVPFKRLKAFGSRGKLKRKMCYQASHREVSTKHSEGQTVNDVSWEAGIDTAPREQYNIPYHSKSLPLGPSIASHLSSSPGFGVSWDQAQKAVNDFVMIFTAHFPFIILDHDVTAQTLFLEKPLLFRTILMIAIDFTPSKSREIRRSVDAWIGQHLLVMEEQSLGALQATDRLSRANPHFYSDRKATQLMYFAIGLAHSLGITKGSSLEDTQAKKETEVNEEHRAFLACYYIVSFDSFQFGRANPLASSYVQYCVESLERSAEFPTDFLLIKLVRFRQFIGQIPTVYQGICDMNWCREISDDASYRLEEIRKDLDDFMSDIAHKHPKFCMTHSSLFHSSSIDMNSVLLWSLQHSALIQLHLPITYAAPDTEAGSRLQLECMKYCLEASRTAVGMAKCFSPDGFLYAPFTTMTDLVSTIIAVSRLLLVEIDGWDLEKARQTIDLKACIDEILAKMKTAKKVKAERVAAAAAENPSSYILGGPDEKKQDGIQVFERLIESIRDWLDSQGVFPTSAEHLKNDGNNELSTSTPIYASPQSPQWNFTFFFEYLLRVNPSSIF